jgi:hypothetical protein
MSGEPTQSVAHRVTRPISVSRNWYLAMKTALAWRKSATVMPTLPVKTGNGWLARKSRMSLPCWLSWKRSEVWSAARSAAVVPRPYADLSVSG